MNGATANGSDADTADEIVIVKKSGLPLEGTIGVAFRGWNLFENHIEKRGHVGVES